MHDPTASPYFTTSWLVVNHLKEPTNPNWLEAIELERKRLPTASRTHRDILPKLRLYDAILEFLPSWHGVPKLDLTGHNRLKQVCEHFIECYRGNTVDHEVAQMKGAFCFYIQPFLNEFERVRKCHTPAPKYEDLSGSKN